MEEDRNPVENLAHIALAKEISWSSGLCSDAEDIPPPDGTLSDQSRAVMGR